MAKDPICGMEVDEKKSKFVSVKNGKTYHFCSSNCKKKFDGVKLNMQKIIPIILVFTLAFFSILSYFYDFMPKFMGLFFITASILKMLDWKGFVNSFSMYDIFARKFRFYGWLYPAVEFLIGVLFLSGYFISYVAFLTFIIMLVGSIGVAKNLLSKNPVKCACLGTLINIPLTKFTLFEDILMAVMALILLI